MNRCDLECDPKDHLAIWVISLVVDIHDHLRCNNKVDHRVVINPVANNLFPHRT